MYVAIIYNDKEIYVQFKEDKFIELLKINLDKFDGDVDKSMEEIIKELKKLSLTR